MLTPSFLRNGITANCCLNMFTYWHTVLRKHTWMSFSMELLLLQYIVVVVASHLWRFLAAVLGQMKLLHS